MIWWCWARVVESRRWLRAIEQAPLAPRWHGVRADVHLHRGTQRANKGKNKTPGGCLSFHQQHAQVSADVETLFAVLSKWEGDDRKQAVQADPELHAGLIDELYPSIAAVREMQPRVEKMHAKAIEPDPDLQTYGPVMKEKVLKLHERFVQLSALAGSVEAKYAEAAQKAQDHARAVARSQLEQERERAERARREEQEALLREQAARAALRAKEEGEREAGADCLVGALLVAAFAVHLL